ncbi:MFS transporter [Streptomyces albus]
MLGVSAPAREPPACTGGDPLQSAGERYGPVLATLCLALMAVMAAMGSLHVALPPVARAAGGSRTQMSWIVDAYALVFAALLLPAGALGDRCGRRSVLLAGFAAFTAGSAAALCVETPGPLIVLRAVAGAAAALVVPPMLSTVSAAFPGHRRQSAVAVWAATAGIGALAGLLASAALLEWFWFSWQSAFAFSAVLAATALVAVWLWAAESAARQRPSFDVLGGALSAAGMVALVYAVVQAPIHGWSGFATVLGLCCGTLLLAAFVRRCVGTPYPLLVPGLFRRPAFTAAALVLTLRFFALLGVVLILVQYLQLVLGETALGVALALVPTAAVLPAAFLSVRATRRSPRAATGAGLLLAAAGLLAMVRTSADSSPASLSVGLAAVGAGIGLAAPPAVIVDALPRALHGVGSAVNGLARECGAALGIAVLTSVLASVCRTHLTGTGVPEAARGFLPAALALGAAVAALAREAFTHGLRLALVTAAATTACAAIAVFLLRARRIQRARAAWTSPARGRFPAIGSSVMRAAGGDRPVTAPKTDSSK